LLAKTTSSIGEFNVTITFSDNETYTTQKYPAQLTLEEKYQIPQVKRAPVRSLQWNFTSASNIYGSTINSVTVVEYTEKSQYFKIPDTLSSPVGYKP
jgi:hypothetical protein